PFAASSRSTSWVMRWFAATSSSRSESRALGCAPDLLGEGDGWESEGLDGIVVGGDVVAGLEHCELVGRQRRARSPLREQCAGARERRRNVSDAAALAELFRDRQVELVPGDDVGAAEVERTVGRSRQVDAACEVFGDVL